MEDRSYRRIFKSTFMIGGAELLNTINGLVRTKILAILLGPMGIGLIGLLNSITGIIGNLINIGVSSSAPREVAHAMTTGDQSRIRRVLGSIQFISVACGILGAVLLLSFGPEIFHLTFGHTNHTEYLAVLSLVVFLNNISGCQSAVIRGLRHVSDLAKASVISSLMFTVIGVPIVYWMGHKGIAVFILVLAAASALVTWYFYRKSTKNAVGAIHHASWPEIKSVISLGLSFMSIGVISSTTVYLVQVLVTRFLGIEAVGLYQAASTLSMVYIGFILNAMATDYYPSLTSVIADTKETNDLINRQTEVASILAMPGLIVTLVFAPFLIDFFYSPQFRPASALLQWQIAGMSIRALSWPMAFVMNAKGAGKLLFMTEMAFSAFYLAVCIPGIAYLGLPGIGISFAAAYIFYWFLVYGIAGRLSQFRLSDKNRRLGGFSLISILIVLALNAALPYKAALMISVLIAAAASYYSYRQLKALGILDDIIASVKKRKNPTGH